MTKFPKRTQSQSTGEIGNDIVTSIVHADLDWVYRRTPQESDFGIDGYIDIITDDGFVTGKSLAVQIKTGTSYFSERTESGWTYRGELKHINYYLNHPTPVVLLLVNPDSKEAYWAVFDANETQRTGAAWKIEIPTTNKFASVNKNRLLNLVGDITDYIPHLEHFWIVNERIKQSEIIYILVSHDEIMHCDVEPFAAVFERLTAPRDVLIHAQNKVDFLIDGYNNHERELYEIPEVREWCQKAVEQIGSFAYFLNMDLRAHGLSVLQSCCCTLREKLDRQIILDPEEVVQFVETLFHGLNQFTECHNFGLEKNMDASMKLFEKLQLGSKFLPDGT